MAAAGGEEHAATAMQAASRGAAQRRENAKNDQVAVGLQAAARGRADRKKVDRMRNPTEEDLELQALQREYQEEMRARKAQSQQVAKAQALSRGFSTRKEVEEYKKTAPADGIKLKINTAGGVAAVKCTPRLAPRKRGDPSSICFVPSRRNIRQHSRCALAPCNCLPLRSPLICPAPLLQGQHLRPREKGAAAERWLPVHQAR